MFVAINHLNERVNPIDTGEKLLRYQSKNKQLFCPECKSQVLFASGEQVTAHFKHVNKQDCSYDWELETEEHLRGKILIRNWLIKQYPEAQVEFEYKIHETNQRADVMAIFPTGEKIAFEMQCSRIQGSVWKERHNLYKSANIRDIWIIGQSVHRYGKTEGQVDKQKHQLVSLVAAIYDEMDSIFFLDTVNETIKGLYEHNFKYWHSETILCSDEENFDLMEAKIFKQVIGTDKIRDDFKKWYIKKKEDELEERQLKEEEKRNEAIRREREKQRVLIYEQRRNEYLTKLNHFQLDDIQRDINKKETALFERLLEKHQYNDSNFPGVFNVFTAYNHLISTPHCLWQLWIFDRFIYHKREPNDKILLPNIQKELQKLARKGKFRYKKSEDDHFIFAIYQYFKKMNLLDVVRQLGFYSGKYQKVIKNQLPPNEDKELNKCVANYLSFFDLEFPKSIDTYIRNQFKIYKNDLNDMENYDGESSIDNEWLMKLKYSINLAYATEGLLNNKETGFMEQAYNLVGKGYELSDKQRKWAESLITKIERSLNISLEQN